MEIQQGNLEQEHNYQYLCCLKKWAVRFQLSWPTTDAVRNPSSVWFMRINKRAQNFSRQLRLLSHTRKSFLLSRICLQCNLEWLNGRPFIWTSHSSTRFSFWLRSRLKISPVQSIRRQFRYVLIRWPPTYEWVCDGRQPTSRVCWVKEALLWHLGANPNPLVNGIYLPADSLRDPLIPGFAKVKNVPTISSITGWF